MDELTGLSKREREVVELLLEGKSNKLIASSLSITENTVEFHLKNIYSKAQVSSRTELILKLRKPVVADSQQIAENRGWFTPMKEAASRIGKEFKMENGMRSTAASEAGPMTFFESILVCLKKYADFHGRASRPEFWWFALFISLVASAFAYVNETLVSIFLIAILLPLLAVGTRRLRDCGMSGWWQLFLLAPVGGLVLLGFLWARPSTSTQSEETQPG
jgi:DNA-binding CsgD family transcriptional regulator